MGTRRDTREVTRTSGKTRAKTRRLKAGIYNVNNSKERRRWSKLLFRFTVAKWILLSDNGLHSKPFHSWYWRLKSCFVNIIALKAKTEPNSGKSYFRWRSRLLNFLLFSCPLPQKATAQIAEQTRFFQNKKKWFVKIRQLKYTGHGNWHVRWLNTKVTWVTIE